MTPDNLDQTDQAINRLFQSRRNEMKHSLPVGLKESILGGVFPKTRRPSFFSWMSFGAGALATCMALVMAFQLGRMTVNGSGSRLLTEDAVSSHVRSLMANHLSDVVSTDQHTVKPWFEGKIDFGPTVKDFAPEGFVLVGGRLDYIGGRPTAALVYKFNQHVINLLQHPAASSKFSEPRLRTVRGYQVFAWEKDGMSYWAVSDVNAADLQRFVSLWL